MSDFDKEAERQRLREKYERDRQKREATQRMSELLLQGATMTNKHCDACGDPIFRYDGQEFCPTCQAAESEGTDATADAGGEAAETSASAGADATAASAGDAADSSSSEASATEAEGASADAGSEADAGAETDAEAQPRAAREGSDGGSAPGVNGRVGAGSAGEGATEPTATSAAASPRSTAAREDSGADVADARASLVRTLTRLSREAEAAEDPRRAREYLAAAREAAEAVAALDR